MSGRPGRDGYITGAAAPQARFPQRQLCLTRPALHFDPLATKDASMEPTQLPFPARFPSAAGFPLAQRQYVEAGSTRVKELLSRLLPLKVGQGTVVNDGGPLDL